MKDRQKDISFVLRFLILIMPFTIAFPIVAHNLSILATLTYFLIRHPQEFTLIKNHKYDLFYWLLFIQLLLCLTGLLYTADIIHGWADVERAIYPLAIMIIFPLVKYHFINKAFLLKYFTIGCFVLVVIALIFTKTSLSEPEFTFIVNNGHSNFTKYVGIQPLYFSVCFILITFYLLESIRFNLGKTSFPKLLPTIVGVILAVIMIFFLRSKTALLLLPTLLIIYLVIILKRRGWWVAFTLLLVTLLTFLLDKDGPPEFINTYGRTVSKAFDQRLMIWQGAIEGIKQAPIFGAGTGDTQTLLNEGYARIGYEEGIINNYNAHNQYLQFMARNGLPELICFLAILAYSFWKSTKQSNYTFLMFNMLVALVMLTESFLSVQKGIAFFYFFLMAFNYLPDKEQENQQI